MRKVARKNQVKTSNLLDRSSCGGLRDPVGHPSNFTNEKIETTEVKHLA